MKSWKLASLQANLRYHDLPGAGPPLVFIHGLGCASSCDYPTVAADPVLAGRRMLLIDLLGAGFSDAPADFDYTIEAHAGTIAELISGLGFAELDLFGHSMGGAVAIMAAGLLGRRLRRLVLSEPNLEPGGGVFSRRISAGSEVDFVAGGHERLVRASHAEGNGIWAASLSVAAAYAVHRGASSLVAGSTPTWFARLCALDCPRTVVFGSATLPHADFDRLGSQGIALSIVADAGHSMAWDNPAGLAAAIAGALS